MPPLDMCPQQNLFKFKLGPLSGIRYVNKILKNEMFYSSQSNDGPIPWSIRTSWFFFPFTFFP